MRRKDFLRSAAALSCLSVLSGRAQTERVRGELAENNNAWFGYCMNTGTIRGHKLGLAGEIELTARAGYDAIEPWIGTIDEYRKAGGSLADLKKRCTDLGLKVCSAIGFARWIVNDERQRAEGVEQMKRDMDLLARIGGTHIAAPPAGAYGAESEIALDAVAERYLVILKAGVDIGVIPQIESWGGSANLSHLSEALYVAAQAGHPDVRVLADVFHMYRSDTHPSAARLLSREVTHCFHINDYPADPPRDKLRDSDRVWPGDGIAPLNTILGALRANRCRTYLSLELFNKNYWQMEALEAARTGLARMKACVAQSTSVS